MTSVPAPPRTYKLSLVTYKKGVRPLALPPPMAAIKIEQWESAFAKPSSHHEAEDEECHRQKENWLIFLLFETTKRLQGERKRGVRIVH